MEGKEDERRVYPRVDSPLTRLSGIRAQTRLRTAKNTLTLCPKNSLDSGYFWLVLPLRWRLGAITISFNMAVVLCFSRSVPSIPLYLVFTHSSFLRIETMFHCFKAL